MAKHTIGEEWRPVPGYEGIYEISNLGRLKSFRFRIKGPTILTPNRNSRGYCRYWLYNGTSRKNVAAHRMVLNVFVGTALHGYVCNHKNGIRHDNRLQNLEWVTISDNNSHAYATLNKKPSNPCGETAGASKLNASQVKEIVSRHRMGETSRSLAKEHSVTDRSINQILSGETWNCVTGFPLKRHDTKRSRLVLENRAKWLKERGY
jgi:hypothetical protein